MKEKIEGKIYTSQWTICKDPLRILDCPHCNATIILTTPKLVEKLKKWAKDFLFKNN